MGITLSAEMAQPNQYSVFFGQVYNSPTSFFLDEKYDKRAKTA